MRPTKARTSDNVDQQRQVTVCPNVKCGKIFSEPVKLTVRKEGTLETYYACPHCFSRISPEDKELKRTAGPLDGLNQKALKDSVDRSEKTKPKGCSHFLGYLKTRPKDSPIPEQCLICSNILECM